MFEPLIEARGGAKRRTGGTVVSLLVHAMVVAGAVQATERVVTFGGGSRSDTLVFVVQPPKREARDGGEETPLPGAPAPVVEGILPDMPPIDVPAMNPLAPAFDAAKVVNGQAPAGVSGIAGEQERASGVAGVFASADVDDPAVALSQPAPRYPVEFERAGVHGYVELEYVIDATGHAEPASVRVIASSMPPSWSRRARRSLPACTGRRGIAAALSASRCDSGWFSVREARRPVLVGRAGPYRHLPAQVRAGSVRGGPMRRAWMVRKSVTQVLPSSFDTSARQENRSAPMS